ncbi:TrkH family potassium uptake protein [Xanthovirga aplysinae]|uniref:TrkH family potassium uptake protein n=1 Tax=Xanthovirga aplysinae TaxID=2529853 RepID=UPI0012BD44EC|nr:potassium transporter TrkG [Xanthovirga aplysinae]MTI31027.1 potassium transporter TrkH [Xanthovirga aplysinae]
MKRNFVNRFLSWYKKIQVSKSPQMNLVWGFFLYNLIGVALLSIPVFHKSHVSFLDNLFISTSAISTTGLVTVSVVDSYNIFGQIIIMLLFQFGGIGYMTLTSYYLFLTTKKITNWHEKIIGTEFTMPKTILVIDFLKTVVLFTLVTEIIGAICFFIAFKNPDEGVFQVIWYSVFHSVSAFCTAGFALFNDSFEGFQDNRSINSIISVLSIAGSLGFIVFTDVWYRISGKSKSVTFTSKIIIYGFLILLSSGTILLYLTEPLVHQSGTSALMKSFFKAMTAMTTVGFNTVSTGALTIQSLLLVVFLMYIGASPSGTAGGMKITTLTAMIAVLKSRIFGQKDITFLNNRIPFERLYVATSTFILYTSLIFLFTFLLMFSEKAVFENILFEVASALGTVGLSTGITGDLSPIGKILIIMLMFIGRVGVLTFGFALLARKQSNQSGYIENDLAV